MAYLSNAERFGIEKGFKQGCQKGEAMMLMRQLARKFGVVKNADRQKILHADADKLLEWGERIFDANTIEEVLIESHA